MKRLFKFKEPGLSSPLRFTIIYSLPFLVVLIVLLAALIAWEKRSHEEEQTAEFIEAGRAFFKQIVIARKWNALHGGVYVEITGDTRPNPFLEDPERDIVSIPGKKYTKINPAYMTRQMSELANSSGDYKFHITSLSPINPYNAPDEWETKALKDFEQGREERYALMVANKRKYFRYMGPLFVEEPCIQCHSKQGYHIGDIRGGISINIPADTSDAMHAAKTKRTIISFALIGVAAMIFIFGITWSFSKRIIRGIERDLEHKRIKALMELAGATAHELRQPLTVILGHIEILKQKIRENKLSDEDVLVVKGQCDRMDDIIRKMLNITHYRTKEYSDGVEIFDFHEQPGESDKEGREN